MTKDIQRRIVRLIEDNRRSDNSRKIKKILKDNASKTDVRPKQ